MWLETTAAPSGRASNEPWRTVVDEPSLRGPTYGFSEASSRSGDEGRRLAGHPQAPSRSSPGSRRRVPRRRGTAKLNAEITQLSLRRRGRWLHGRAETARTKLAELQKATAENRAITGLNKEIAALKKVSGDVQPSTAGMKAFNSAGWARRRPRPAASWALIGGVRRAFSAPFGIGSHRRPARRFRRPRLGD